MGWGSDCLCWPWGRAFDWSCSPRGGDIWIFLRPTWRYLTADSDEKDWDRTYVSLTFFVPFTKNGIFRLTKCGLSPKGLCILRSVTRIMVKTYNCSCNRNMYLWWCSNVYKRLQSFIWRYFYCAFLGFCLGIDSNVRLGVGKFGCIWLEWFARGQWIWLQIFEKSWLWGLKRAGYWGRNASRSCFWDGCWGCACQLLVNFFPIPSNSSRSLWKSELGPVS